MAEDSPKVAQDSAALGLLRFCVDDIFGMIYNTIMKKIIIDTNVLIAGLQSKQGKSYRLLQLLYEDKFKIAVSVPLALEYEALLKKKLDRTIFSDEHIEGFIDYLCMISEHIKIYYLWRPYLKDAFDDHVLELALASNCDYIVTYNLKDFKHAENLGIRAITPGEFIKMLSKED